jgi:hypothetical protein
MNEKPQASIIELIRKILSKSGSTRARTTTATPGFSTKTESSAS